MFCRAFKSELDIEWIVQELRALPQQSQTYNYVEDDPAWVEGYFRVMGSALIGAVDADKGAFILGQYGPTWFSSKPTVHEMILWVPEQHRGSRLAIHLIKKFAEVCAHTDAFKIVAGASLDIVNNEKTLRLYELCGFTRVGTGVEKVLNV